MTKQMIPCVLLALTVSACNNLELVDKTMNLKLDPALSPASKALLRADVKALENYQVSTQKGGYFSKAFGSTDETGVLRYMNDRVNYIVPQVDDLSSRIKLGWISLPSSDPSPDPTTADPSNDGRAVVMALNIGSALWFANEANSLPINLRFKIGNTSIPLTSPRVGIVELGEGYTMTETPGGTPITTVLRTATLVHEARHSDCTGGMTSDDLEQVRIGSMPQNRECGHLHVSCPEGHPLAGLPACDDLAWGAYSVEALFTAALAQNCTSCTEEEKQQALMNTADSFSRVTVLEQMLNGSLGDPDMSSSSKIIKKDPAVRALLSAIESERNSGNTQSATIEAE